MASPNQSQTAAPSTQPLTPPAEPSNTNTTTTNNASSQQQQPATGSSTTSAPVAQPTQVPSTSLKDSGKSRRPRDVRLIHMLLASLGVTSYQERVPLQLLDFAYRYTSGVLQDASISRRRAMLAPLPALRLSIASRLHYQFQTGLPKEFLMDVAAERNRVALPGATRGLPPERFCLTGVGWNMKDEWESEGEEEVEEEEEPKESNHAGAGGEEEEGDGGEEDEDGKMEDIFGEDAVMGDGDGDDDGDKDMTDV
ncbi:transcription initiation factor TFIID, 31kD subunit [Aspergillus nomiae NRRL 13137]|uniref:Transcription initiation factor TFIID, 31kD subunit n=1 Tax=Aspergillus nomiae NRRL (strain ATCC 15546 / NRRL 13137 / CBS 260.88 / M93) TaxID=1509407 RepID=A0A0L1J7A6_ASPN3|nr:transcription initiation factor TFIID, 31kD subunit [Aspergillus nomiae NRRL 13137]KNG87550.1 transcription initiation factor TFIID, 31kD subunit [Aspergillus nomiae NRRL 13137]